MWPSPTPPGAKPPSDWGPNAASRLPAYPVGPLGQPGLGQRRRGGVRDVLPGAGEGLGGVAGQRRGQHPGVGLVVGVRIGVGRALHLLGGDGDLQRPVVTDLLQGVVERVGGEVGVEHLLGGAPALGGPLLEEPERVPVAVLDVEDLGLLVRRGQGDRDGSRGQPATLGDRGDQRRVLRLLRREAHRAPVHLGDALVLGQQRPDPAVEDDADGQEERDGDECGDRPAHDPEA